MIQKKIIPTPTDSELEILQVLWQNGQQTVRFINDALNEKRGADQKEIGYTTTLKLMQIMLEKGLLERDIIERSHIYTPAIHEKTTQEQVLRTVVNNAFNGSASNLVLRALGSNNTSREELEKIKKLITEIEKNTYK
jgi:BlaI family penicillinase repressor